MPIYHTLFFHSWNLKHTHICLALSNQTETPVKIFPLCCFEEFY